MFLSISITVLLVFLVAIFIFIHLSNKNMTRMIREQGKLKGQANEEMKSERDSQPKAKEK